MRYITKNTIKIFDEENSKFIMKFINFIGIGNCILTMCKPSKLYISKNGNWIALIESIDPLKLKAYEVEVKVIEKLLLDLNEIEIYEKYFKKLEIL